MKKLTLLLFVAILLTACQQAAIPQPTAIPPTDAPISQLDVAKSWQGALNNGDIDAALSFLSEDAIVKISPAGPEGDAIFTGHAEIRGWYETLTAGKGVTTLSDCKVAGDTLTCLDSYADEGLKSMGVDFIEGEWVAAINDGRIQSYTFTASPESLAKLAPPVIASTNQPPATPTRGPNESLASSVDDLVGKWWFSQAGVILEFQANGTYSVYAGSETQDEGTYTFDTGLVTWVTGHPSCGDRPATYEANVTKQDNKPIWLRLQVVGSDPCSARADTTANKARFQKP